jgi:hypothetical protein
MKQHASTSIRIIYWFTEITFWIYAAISLFAVGMALMLMLGFLTETQLTVGLPVSFDSKEVSEISINQEMVEVEMKKMVGRIHFIDTPVTIARIYGAWMLLICALFFYAFLTFRKFIRNVMEGQFFERSNIALLKRISYMLLVFWVLTVLYSTMQFFMVGTQLNFDTLQVGLNIQLFPTILLVALFIWVLSHIFMKGAELQEESNLTV